MLSHRIHTTLALHEPRNTRTQNLAMIRQVLLHFSTLDEHKNDKDRCKTSVRTRLNRDPDLWQQKGKDKEANIRVTVMGQRK